MAVLDAISLKIEASTLRGREGRKGLARSLNDGIVH